MRNLTLPAFRIAAYIVGFGLLTLVLIAMPLKYLGHAPEMAAVVSPIHGFLYILYVMITIALARQSGWTLKRSVGVMAAGTIPFLSFFIERKAVRWVETAQ